MPEITGARYAADEVFTALASEILQGLCPMASVLPAERQIAERFAVSKLVVRAAMHRLAEAGLVIIRQGGATKVTDPSQSTSLKVIELYYQLAPTHPAMSVIARDVLEKQFTQGMSLLNVFLRRASLEAKRDLPLVVMHAIDKDADLAEAFWRAIAEGGGNRVLTIETRWLYKTLKERPPSAMSKGAEAKFYAGLAQRVRDDAGAIDFYVETLAPAIDALFAKPKRRSKLSPRKGVK